MKVITLSKVKELLGITDSSYDSQINRYIPIIDSKVKMITGSRYNYQIIGDVKSGDTSVEIMGLVNSSGGINNNYYLDDLREFIQPGDLISGDTIASDSYIDEVYYNGSSVNLFSEDKAVPVIILNQAATSTDFNAGLFVGINIALQPIIAKGIWWMISQENTTSTPSAGVNSKSIGSISISYSGKDAEIDGKYGMPNWFIKGFPSFMRVF